MVVANFVIAMLIVGLLGFAIADLLARSLARDDRSQAGRTDPAGAPRPRSASDAGERVRAQRLDAGAQFGHPSIVDR